MKSRMGIATFTLVVSGFTLAACGGDDPPPAEPTASATTTTTPSAPATVSTAEDLVGDWEDVDAKWIVHFKDDGTYVEDFEGVTDFRVGKYAVEGTSVALIGDDGNTDKGTIDGTTLDFQLGDLTRKQ